MNRNRKKYVKRLNPISTPAPYLNKAKGVNKVDGNVGDKNVVNCQLHKINHSKKKKKKI
jgi:hypothetical protein